LGSVVVEVVVVGGNKLDPAGARSYKRAINQGIIPLMSKLNPQPQQACFLSE
jgi:hypothetical protein